VQAASLYISISIIGSGGGEEGDDGGGEDGDGGGEDGEGSGAGCTIIPEVPTLSVDCITPTTE